MKKVALFLLLIATFKGNACASWKGQLDLSPVVSPLLIRELHDGQWLFGVTKENVFHLDYHGDAASRFNGQRFHAGFFQAWNAEHGNPTFGLVAGIDLPPMVGPSLGAIGSALNLDQTVKPLQYAGNALSVDLLLGYRPVHTADVNGNLTYGFALRLNTAFGVKELQRGL